MNKRIFGLILALAMLGSVLTGCGNKNNTSASLRTLMNIRQISMKYSGTYLLRRRRRIWLRLRLN